MIDELPQGWCHAGITEVAEVFLGKTPARTDYTSSGSLKVVKFRDIHDGRVDFSNAKDGFVRNNRDVPSGLRELRPGDVLITSAAHSGENIGKKCAYVSSLPDQFSRVFFTGELLNIRCLDDTLSRWAYLFFRSVDGFSEIQEAVTGVHLTGGRAKQMRIPVAPLPEQRRIVRKLEKLLEKVDACQQRLAKIPVLLKRFRQAILAAACSGRLTADWREENANQSSSSLVDEIKERRKEFWLKQRKAKGVAANPADYPEPAKPSDEFEFDVPESWEICSMDALTSVITSGSRDWKQYYRHDGSGTFIMAQNIRPMRFDRSYRLAVAPPENDRDRVRSEVFKNDLLVTIVGANTGDSCRVPVELGEHYVCQSVALMRPVAPETSPFLELFLNSSGHGLAEWRKWIYGEGRPHLSFDNLRETSVCLPPLAEQQEILRRVEALFALADQIEARYTKAKAYVEKLTPSLLARAFRGKLVPQNPNDEPATVLLERIRNAKRDAARKQSAQLCRSAVNQAA
jgi:type I restriction enzyme S subunit